MARMFHLLGLSVLGFALTGCVAQEKYNALKLDRDGYVERLARAEGEALAARGEADLYKGQLGTVAGNTNSKDGLLANYQQQLAQLQQQNTDLERQYLEAVNSVGKGAVLPPSLNTALENFASQNPGLVDFDSARGMVKFRSDLTFATGSADVTPQARGAIGSFAQILNSAEARGHELAVAGHTDTQRVSNPETLKKGHRDNWYLSAHRAIAVKDELEQRQVNPQRIGVLGYADQRPIADNGTGAGRQQNRRVEVLILPSTVRGGNTATAGAAPSRQPAAPSRPALNKDTVGVDRGPVLNK